MMLNIIFYGKSLVYNLGGQSRLTILELANIIGEITEAEVLLPEIPQTITGNPKIVNISIDKYFIEFGNKKFIPIKEGLIKTINWQKKLYDNEKNNN
jgi:dTDP-glucose 4,6-dehydratase/UDP-glucuronate decarboxylase